MLQLIPDFCPIANVELFYTRYPLSNEFHEFQQPQLGLHVGANLEKIQALQQCIEKAGNLFTSEEAKVAVEKVQINKKKQLILNH